MGTVNTSDGARRISGPAQPRTLGSGYSFTASNKEQTLS